jgi:hypothetical protein
MAAPFLNTYAVVVCVELVTKPIHQVYGIKHIVSYVPLIHLSIDSRILVNFAF